MRSLATLCVLFFTCLFLAAPLATHAQVAEPTATTAAAAPITEYHLPAEQLKQSAALYRTRMLTFVAGTIYGIMLLIVLLNLRVGARFRDWAERTSSRRFVQAIIFVPLLLLTVDILSPPIG